MGTWGNKLYDNDTALDVQGDVEDLCAQGKNGEEIVAQLTAAYRPLLDTEEEPLFWLALADTLWEHDMLTSTVKDKALFWLGQGKKAAADGQVRLDMIEKLQNKLLSSPSAPPKQRRSRLYRCPWQIGDVFAYPLESDIAKERGLAGRYLLVQKIGEGTWYPGHIVPVVYVKITADHNLPTCTAEYDQLPYVQLRFTRWEERFWPIDGKRPAEDMAKKSKLTYERDEYGLLPQFRTILVITSKRTLPSKLTYVGNFSDAVRPLREFVPHDPINLFYVGWKQAGLEFETTILKRYFLHNLREHTIYKTKGEQT